MREGPPHELVALIERLEMATAGQVGRMGRRVRRLARRLPLFDSVWVDALAQARILTPFQASEIIAGRGDTLRIGPYVLSRRLPSPGYVECYTAREIESPETARVAVFQVPSGEGRHLITRLEALAATCQSLNPQVLAPTTRTGVDGGRVWAAGRDVRGRTAAEWMVRAGRFPPNLVLEIARQMLTGLILLEEAGLCHGDISASGLVLTDDGDVVLPQPGLRGAIHPDEGAPCVDLVPEAYDYLAPERIAERAPPSTLADVYACGCLWWHLLAGRPPVPGGTTPAKLRAIDTARIPDVCQLAPATPGRLAAAISASVQREPASRPDSMARLGDMLGPPTKPGKRALSRYLTRPVRAATHLGVPGPTGRGSKRSSSWLATTTGCLAAATAITWSLWHSGLSIPAASTPAQSPDAILEPTARAAQPTDARTTGSPSTEVADEEGPDDLVLQEGGPVAIESLEFRPGQCVRGEPGCRPLVVVPDAGLVVRPEGLQFEDIDFVCREAAAATLSTDAPAAMIHVLAARAEFRGCSFRAANRGSRAPVAVRWTHPADRGRAELALFSGQLQLSDCVLHGVGAAVACETLGASAVEMGNVLHLGTGPLVQLDHCPNVDEPVLIGLSNVTLRGAGPLLECRYERIEDQPGTISIQADSCALATRPDAPLLSFIGRGRPDRILNRIRWTGQGSLVLPDAIIAAWRQPDGEPQVLDDALVSIAGLVRSGVGFAGPAETGPDASRIVRWQVPLRSPDPPGVDPQTLAWPVR